MKPSFRKLTAVLLAVGMAASFAGCGSSNEDTLAEYLAKNGMTQEQLDNAVAHVVTPAPTENPAEETPAPTVSPEPTAAPTPTPAPQPPVVTQNPAAVTLTEGGNAVFNANADNYQYVTWRLMNSDASVIIYMNEAPYTFPGLSVNGDGTSRLTLCNCPVSMTGWAVDAVFTNNGISVPSYRAYITVNSAPKTQIFASPSSGYFQYEDTSIYIFGDPGVNYNYELYRDDGYGSYLYRSGTKECGDYVTLTCDSGTCCVYYLYAYETGDSTNALSCSYTMDGVMPVSETVYGTEGFDNAGFASRYVSQSGWYSFYAECPAGEYFDVYVLSSAFNDADRYIPQAYSSSMTLYNGGSGGLYLNAGQYVYVCCSANGFSGDKPSPHTYIQWSMG